MILVCLFSWAAINSAARLMGCSSQELMVTLSTRKILAGKDTIAKKLTLWQVCLLIVQFNNFSLCRFEMHGIH